MKKRLFIFISIIIGLVETSQAQTNNPATNAPTTIVGTTVRVASQHPLVVIGRATVTAETTNTITVATRFETFTFIKTNVTLVPIQDSDPQSNQRIYYHSPNPPPTGPNTSSTDPGMDILNQFQKDPNFSKAVAQYQSHMNQIQSGQIDVKQLRAMAAQTLAEADQYQPERAKDPKYEAYINQLRDFVKRADAGEQFNFSTGSAQ